MASDGTLAPAVGSYQDVAATAYPSISADGKKMVFISDASSLTKVWIMDVGTGRRRMLTPTQNPEVRPIHSPDGTRVAFRSRVDRQRSDTMVADVASLDQLGAPHSVCAMGAVSRGPGGGTIAEFWPRWEPLRWRLPASRRQAEAPRGS